MADLIYAPSRLLDHTGDQRASRPVAVHMQGYRFAHVVVRETASRPVCVFTGPAPDRSSLQAWHRSWDRMQYAPIQFMGSQQNYALDRDETHVYVVTGNNGQVPFAVWGSNTPFLNNTPGYPVGPTLKGDSQGRAVAVFHDGMPDKFDPPWALLKGPSTGQIDMVVTNDEMSPCTVALSTHYLPAGYTTFDENSPASYMPRRQGALFLRPGEREWIRSWNGTLYARVEAHHRKVVPGRLTHCLVHIGKVELDYERKVPQYDGEEVPIHERPREVQ